MRLAYSPVAGTTSQCLTARRLSSPITVEGTFPELGPLPRRRHLALRAPRPGKFLAVARQQIPTQAPSTPENLRYPAAGYQPREASPQQQSPAMQWQYPPMQPRQAGRSPQEGRPQYQQQPREQKGGYGGQERGAWPQDGGGGRGEQGWGLQFGQGRQPVDPRAGQLVLRVCLAPPLDEFPLKRNMHAQPSPIECFLCSMLVSLKVWEQGKDYQSEQWDMEYGQRDILKIPGLGM